MKSTIKRYGISFMLFASLLPIHSYASAYSPPIAPFPIGIHWPPPPSQTSNAAYKDIKDMNANFIVGGNGLDTFAKNDAALASAAANGLKVLVQDLRTSPPSVFANGNKPTDSEIDDVVQHYKTNSALQGYVLVDEPPATSMPGLGYAMERMRQQDPAHMTFVNLYPNTAEPAGANLGLYDFTGELVSSSHRVGQTFKTKPGQTTISTIQMWIDRSSWSIGEELTLKLWDSPAKATLIAQNTLTGATTNSPRFALNATVTGNTSYYMELTHNGVGDNSIGWVVHSKSGINWFRDGEAYVNGTAIDADFWYTVNQNVKEGSYEDYVYRWVSQRPDVLAFDHYPFLQSGFSDLYYENLEIIRRQSQIGGIDFWSYIQAVGYTPANIKAPTQNEMRYQIYTNLAYGAKGIIYFTYMTPGSYGETGFHDGLVALDGTKNASYNWAANLNAEVLKLGPTLMKLKSNAVYHTGSLPNATQALPDDMFWQVTDASKPTIVSTFTGDNGVKYVMVVNRDTSNARTLTFSLPFKPGSVKEVSKSTGAEVSTNYNPSTGILSSSFAPGEGRLYAIHSDCICPNRP
ncbi:hypothetical protein [Cohnella sp. GbtcB17]|uniref:hypothetical protein n=1 Tax=Cohnella sp. GbtcB17 TaxID=2824762 RepID=UPI001C30DAEC|nr:hypothetical protein [Cohnella sp. GbtcB17]